MKKKQKSEVAACCLLPSGVITVSMALLMGYYVIPYKIWEGVMKESKLIQGDNPRYNGWAKVPIPLFQHIYLFNVTNPDGVVGSGEKPVLQELGPYVYEMTLEKFDIVFNENNGTFFYRERAQYYFREDLSSGSESDPIVSINIPYVGLAQEASTLDTISRYFLLEIMKQHASEQLYFHTTVGQLLFQGTYLPFMKELSDLNGEEVLPNNTFGIMYNQNGSDQGLFEIYSGQKDPDKFGILASWNNHAYFEWWSEDEFCRRLNGSDGIFEPYAMKDRTYYMFMPGMCRSFPLTFERGGDHVFGVPVYKYSVPKYFLENPIDNPDNACYFAQVTQPYPESGVFPMRGCGKGPMMLSQPHFYQGSEVYLNQTVGLSPDKEKHEMTMLLEPYTATPMRVKVRFQMNVELNPTKYFKTLRKLRKMVHPVFWMEQISGAPEKDADTIRNKLVFAIQIVSLVTIVLVLVGVLLILVSVILFLCRNRKTKLNCDESERKNGLTTLLFDFQNSYNNHRNKIKKTAMKTEACRKISCSSGCMVTGDAIILPIPDANLRLTPVVEVNSSETVPFLSKPVNETNCSVDSQTGSKT